MIPLLNFLLFPLLLLLTLSIPNSTEACSCMLVHPQQQFCSSDIVIRANIRSKKEIPSYPPPSLIQYEIKQIKMFKGFEKMKIVKYVYTPSSSGHCGVHLSVEDKKMNEYLLSGDISSGRVSIDLCKFIKPWKELTHSEKINLQEKYEKGCVCKITDCTIKACHATTHQECLWSDWRTESKLREHQEKNSACFKDGDGVCKWHDNLLQ